MEKGFGRKNREGITLAEVMVVLAILSILTAIALPSLSGFLNKVKEKTYVIEASSIQGSLQAFMVEEYAKGNLDSPTLFRDVTMYDLRSEENPLHSFLRVVPTKDAAITGITIDTEKVEILELVYQVDGYKITLTYDVEMTRESDIMIETLDGERQEEK